MVIILSNNGLEFSDNDYLCHETGYYNGDLISAYGDGTIIYREDLLFQNGSSDKVYIGTVIQGNDGNYNAVCFYGRRGNNLTLKHYGFSHGVTAILTTINKKLAEKKSKGYVSVNVANINPNDINQQTNTNLAPTRIVWPMGAAPRPKPDKLKEYMESPDWIDELKYDGVRATMHILKDGKGARFFGRSCTKENPNIPNEFTSNIPHLAKLDYPIETEYTILDGELLSTKFSQATEISGQLNAKDGRDNSHIYFMAYDCIQFKQTDLVNEPWKERRTNLTAIISYIKSSLLDQYKDLIHISTYSISNKWDFHQKAVEAGWEGTILKNINATYKEGSKPVGVFHKVKRGEGDSDGKEYDVIITGFTEGKGKYKNQIGAVEFSQVKINCDENDVCTCNSDTICYKTFINNYFKEKDYNPKEWCTTPPELIKIGQCSGMTDQIRQDITDNKNNYLGKCLIVEAHGRTKTGALTWPRWVGLHPDKGPEECIIEEE